VIRISYHASHEQFAPRELLGYVVQAEKAGWDGVFSSDHINPWSPGQGQSGFMWAWLGAALQATKRVSCACITVPGGWRYSPAITAQAIATLGEMFCERFPYVALGSGEALNEGVVGKGWPNKAARAARLDEAALLVRRLLAGETVTHSGAVRVENARLWSRPGIAPKLFGAALTAATAARISRWADGLLTTAADPGTLKDIVSAFRQFNPTGPLHAKIDLSWAATEDQALDQAHQQWRMHCLDRAALHDLRTPEEFELAAREVKRDDIRRVVLVSSDLSQHVRWLRERIGLGFTSLDLHNVGRNQEDFIRAFGAFVLPELRKELAQPASTYLKADDSS
jgi:coenzyme F420-dependent glucose-6-phosphate dehydrogenase